MNGRRRRMAAAVAVAALASGCLDPLDNDADEGAAAETPLGSEAFDQAEQVLAEEVERLVALLADLHGRLEAAAGADDLDAVKAAAADVEAGLIGDPGDGDVLFPVEDLDRGNVSDRDDLMTRTLAAARQAGGDEARAVTEGVRDLVAGDLGGWQRDAEGMVAWADEVAVEQGSLEEIERRILELPGGGTQALAYVRLIDRTSTLEQAQAYAERGAAHLAVARSVLADLDLGDEGDAAEEQARRTDTAGPAHAAASSAGVTTP